MNKQVIALASARRSYARLAYQNGISPAVIANDLGVHYHTVYTYTKDLVPKRTRVTPEIQKQIVDMTNAKYTRKEIADTLHISVYQVSRWRTALGLNVKDKLPLMMEMRLAGKTNKEIAKRLNVSYSCVRAYLGVQPAAMTRKTVIVAGAIRRIRRRLMAMPVDAFTGDELNKLAA